VRGDRRDECWAWSPILPEELRFRRRDQYSPRDVADEPKQRVTLLTERSRRGLHSSDEVTPTHALTPEARLPMNDHRPDSSFRHVVRRLYAFDGHEGPHGRLRLQDAATLARRFVPATSRTSVEKRERLGSKRTRPSLKVGSVKLAVFVQMPEPEDVVDQRQELFANPAQLLFAFGHRAEVADQVSEAHLPLVQVDERVAAVAVADRDAAGLLPDQLLGHLGPTRVADEKRGCLLANRSPEPGEGPRFAPRRLVQVFRGRFSYRGQRFGVGPFEPIGDPALDVRDRAERDRNAACVGEPALNVAPRDSVFAGHQRDLSGDVRTEVARVDISRELCSRRLAALTAGQRMELNLKDAGLDRGDVGDLVAEWVRVVTGEASAATLALLRLDHSSLVDILGTGKVTSSSLVTRLGTTFASGRPLLGLRLRPRRVAGGRLARCSGRLRLASLQSLDLRTLLLDHAEEVRYRFSQLLDLGTELSDRLFGRFGLRCDSHTWTIGQAHPNLAPYPRERLPPDAGPDRSDVLGHWRDQSTGSRELVIPSDSDGLVLSLHLRESTEVSADGRLDRGAGASATEVVFGGSHPISIGGAERKEDRDPDQGTLLSDREWNAMVPVNDEHVAFGELEKLVHSILHPMVDQQESKSKPQESTPEGRIVKFVQGLKDDASAISTARSKSKSKRSAAEELIRKWKRKGSEEGRD